MALARRLRGETVSGHSTAPPRSHARRAPPPAEMDVVKPAPDPMSPPPSSPSSSTTSSSPAPLGAERPRANSLPENESARHPTDAFELERVPNSEGDDVDGAYGLVAREERESTRAAEAAAKENSGSKSASPVSEASASDSLNAVPILKDVHPSGASSPLSPAKVIDPHKIPRAAQKAFIQAAAMRARAAVTGA